MNVERAISKKRKIYGVDPNEYATKEEFSDEVEKRISEVCDKKIENITRHINSTEKKYKVLLEELVYYKVFKKYANTSEKIDEEEILNELDNNLRVKRVLEKYINYLYYVDYTDELGFFSIINSAREEIYINDIGHCGPGGGYISKDADVLYLVVSEKMRELKKSIEGKYPYYNYSDKTQKKTIIPFKHHVVNEPYCIDPRTVDFLLQINALKEQLQYYQSIIKNPENVLNKYLSKNDSWASIMQSQYWMRLGRDHHRDNRHDKINLLMIKPGIKIFDEEKIKYFIRRKDKDFKEEYSVESQMLIVTIPNSLEEKSLLDLIDFAHQNSETIRFICQSDETKKLVGQILIEKELLLRTKSEIPLNETVRNKRGYNNNMNYYIKGYYWLITDPNYYDSFFVCTPSNKTLWNQYGCNLSKEENQNIDIETYIDTSINELYNEKITSKVVSKNMYYYYFDYTLSSIAKATIDGKEEIQNTLKLIKSKKIR